MLSTPHKGASLGLALAISLSLCSGAVGATAPGSSAPGASAVTSDQAASDSRPALDPPRDTCIGACTQPTNAAKLFRWGDAAWRQEFVGDVVEPNWRSTPVDAISHREGMLTVRATPDSGTVTAWPTDNSARYGRWEARVRAREFGEGTRPRVAFELVPVTAADTCSAEQITIASYRIGMRRAQGQVRTSPTVAFHYSAEKDLQDRAWHTYAVEVTRDRISWFSDTEVIRTERRPEALSGVRLRPQFRVEVEPGQEVRETWMQMDWARYYTLDRPNAKSVEAPRFQRRENASIC